VNAGLGKTKALSGSCPCGAVTITINEAASFMIDCNCSLCRKCKAVWGYYPSAAVSVPGSTSTYRRSDKDVPSVQTHACQRCSATTHWTLTDEFRAAWSGSGPGNHRLPSRVIGPDHRWQQN